MPNLAFCPRCESVATTLQTPEQIGLGKKYKCPKCQYVGMYYTPVKSVDEWINMSKTKRETYITEWKNTIKEMEESAQKLSDAFWKMIFFELTSIFSFGAGILGPLINQPILSLFLLVGIALVFPCIKYYRLSHEYEAKSLDLTTYEFKERLHNQRKLRKEEKIEHERLEAIESQQSNAPWKKRFFTDPCPYCGHYKVRYSTWDDKKMSVAFWGVWSDKIGKSFHCEYCNRDFNN